MPTLSIIIPVYNSAKYLKACLDSIFAQDFRDYEIIAVNDGSKDNSGEILDKIALNDKRLKVYHQPNGGVSKARNIGIQHASGKFITFIDSDDRIRPGYLSNFTYDETIGIQIQGMELYFVENTSNNKVIVPARSGKCSLKEAYQEAEFLKLSRGPVLKLFNTSVIKDNKILFNENISFGEDAIFVKDYLLKCSSTARTISKADYLYYYYNSSESLTHIRHDPRKKFHATELDYALFCKLEQKLGSFDDIIKQDFVRERTLEMWEELRQSLTDRTMTSEEVCAFWSNVLSGLYKTIPKLKKLPITYRVMEICVKVLGIKNTIRIISKTPIANV